MNKSFLGFAPVYNENSRVLILGSFPSVKSREVNFYYGNPQNRFWKTLYSFFNATPKNGIEEKIAFLKENKIALYDVFSECDIKGSMDSEIDEKNSVAADMTDIFSTAKNLELIICNGKLAYSTFIKNYPQKADMAIYLPSTSSANPSFSYEKWHAALYKIYRAE